MNAFLALFIGSKHTPTERDLEDDETVCVGPISTKDDETVCVGPISTKDDEMVMVHIFPSVIQNLLNVESIYVPPLLQSVKDCLAQRKPPTTDTPEQWPKRILWMEEVVKKDTPIYSMRKAFEQFERDIQRCICYVNSTEYNFLNATTFLATIQTILRENGWSEKSFQMAHDILVLHTQGTLVEMCNLIKRLPPSFYINPSEGRKHTVTTHITQNTVQIRHARYFDGLHFDDSRNKVQLRCTMTLNLHDGTGTIAWTP